MGLIALSSFAHLYALHRDLPIHDIDEDFSVNPAVGIAATGDLNPHSFVWPGSTVIYPVAGFIHVWDAVAHDGPLLGSNSSLTARYEQDPTPFYVIARLWTIALSVGTVPLVYLVGRRAFNTRVALMATAIWTVVPLPVHFGRIVRTDSAGTFFGLLALWLCLRLLDEPRVRWCILAGLSVGLAVASRYFLVALVPCLIAAAILSYRRKPRAALRAAGVALGSALGGFVISTPYFFLDWDAARDSLEYANVALPAARNLSRFGNLRWYLDTAIPDALTWPLVAFAAGGVVLVVWRRRAPRLLLVGFCATFLTGICLSSQHRQRWLITILPVLVLLAAYTVDVVLQRLAAFTPRFRQAPSLALVAVTGALAIQPATDLVETNRFDVKPSTHARARDWILDNVPPGSRLGDDSENAPLEGSLPYVDVAIDPHTDTLEELRRAGYQHLVINVYFAGRSQLDPARFPKESAFYTDIACNTRLVAVFRPSHTHGGLPIRIYRVGEPPRKIYDYFCTQRVED